MRLLTVFILTILFIFIILCSGYADPLAFQGTPPTVPPIPAGYTTIKSDYSYEKSVELIGSPDGILDNYQVKLVVHRGSGTDSDNEVCLNDHSLSWPNDIRFAGPDNADYPYWIESSDASTATIWVKVDSIPASPAVKKMRVLYGLSGDRGASNGPSTFIFFDDFNGAAINWSKWDKKNIFHAKPTVANGYLTVSQSEGGGTAFNTIDQFSINTAAHWKGRTSGSYTEFRCGFGSIDGSDIYSEFYGKYRSRDIIGRNQVSQVVDSSALTSVKDMDHIYDIKRKGTRSVAYSIDDMTTSSLNSQVPISDLNFKICPWDLEGGQSYILDYACIYQTAANEPTFGQWGTEIAIQPVTSMPGYAYAKSVMVQGSPDGVLAGYQMKFIVHNGTGTDSGQDVYLNGHSLSWPNDIRFVSATGTNYSYWIESSDPDTATVWVKVDDIPASPGDTEVKFVYGMAGDVGESDGASTFPFFDDFSSPYLDASKWNSHPESASTYNGMLRVIGNNMGNVLSKSEFGPGYALESRVSITNTGDTDNFVGFCNSDLVTDPYTGAFNSWKSADWMYDGNYVNGDTGVLLSTGWTRLTSIREADGTSVGRINLTGNYVGKADSRQYSVCVHHYGNGATYLDWVLVRKYTQDEPVIGKWSGETAILLPQVTLSLSGYSQVKANTIQVSPDRALTDYQVKYTVHRGDGIDSGQDVYLNNVSQSWPADIRFSDASGVLYPYWMESSDADSAIFWVKIGTIPASPGTTHVLLSYGKPDDVSLSNGDGTFILFDDFNDNTLNGSKWVKVMGDASADAFVKDGMLELQSGNVQDVSRPFIRSADTYAGNYTIDVDAKYLGQNSVIVATNWDGTLAGQFRGPDNGYESFYNSWASGGPYWEIARDTGNQGVNLGQYSYAMDNQFHRISVTQKPGIVLQVDGKKLLTGAIDTKYQNGYVGLGGREDQEGVQTFYDNFRMRQYTEHPPVQGAWTTLASPTAAGVNTVTSQPTSQGSGLTNIIGSNSGIIVLLALALVVLVMLAILALILAITVFKL